MIYQLNEDFSTATTAMPTEHPRRATIEALAGALRLSLEAVSEDPTHLRAQLLGRLKKSLGDGVARFLSLAHRASVRAGLYPRSPSLVAPGGALRCTLVGHQAPITAVALMPNTRRLASGSADQTIRIWDYDSGAELLTLSGHSSPVTALAITRDGKHIVSGSGGVHKNAAPSDNSIRVWDSAAGTALASLLGHTDDVLALLTTFDCEAVISASRDKTLRRWRLQGDAAPLTLTRDLICGIGPMLAPDGKRVAAFTEDKILRTWCVATGEQISHFPIPELDHTTVALLTPDWKRLVVSATGKLWILDVVCGRLLATIPLDGWADVIALGPDGLRVAVASCRRRHHQSSLCELSVYDLDTGNARRIFKDDAGDEPSLVQFLPDGRHVICVRGPICSPSVKHIASVWDIESCKCVVECKGHHAQIIWIAVDAECHRLITGSADGTAKLWDLRTRAQPADDAGHGGEVTRVALFARNRRAVSGGDDGRVVVWDADCGAEVMSLRSHSRRVTDIALTPDGEHAVSASTDRTLKLWDLRSGREVHTLRGHGDAVYAVAVTPDGRRAISGSDDDSLIVWDLKAGDAIRTLRRHRDEVVKVFVTPDGRFAASEGGPDDRAICVWNLETWQGFDLPLRSSVCGVSGARKTIYTSFQNVICGWDLSSGRESFRLGASSAGIASIMMDAECRWAVSTSRDMRTMEVWRFNDNGGELLSSRAGPGWGHVQDVCSDGSLAVCSDACALMVWDLCTGKLVARFLGDYYFPRSRGVLQMQAVVLSSDAALLVAGDIAGGVHFLSLER